MAEVTPLVHDQGVRPCGQVGQYATDSWLAQWTVQAHPVQCRVCNRPLVPADVTAGAPIDETTIP